MMKKKYLISISELQEKEKLKKPKMKRPKPKINIISIDIGGVFDEY